MYYCITYYTLILYILTTYYFQKGKILFMEQKELKIDPELKDLLPPLTDNEYEQLEKHF